ncbi:MAG: DUF111 family protein [Clostridiales bacterium]|nr:MAG: DUF111 family protein [Clostridiales bacterium]
MFSALCDIYDAKILNTKKRKTDVLGIPCSKCTLKDGNIFSESDKNFAKSLSEKFFDGKSDKNDIFCAVKNIIEQINPDYIMSSPIYDGSGFKDGEPVPSVEIAELFQKFKIIPFRTLDKNAHLATKTAFALCTSLANEFGLMSDTEIDKIGYGTDGKRVVRVITGFDKQKGLSDIFEISEDSFSRPKKTVYCSNTAK